MSASTLTFSDLQTAVARLAADPRVEPHTPIHLHTSHPLPDGDFKEVDEPIATIACVESHGWRSIEMSAHNAAGAVVR